MYGAQYEHIVLGPLPIYVHATNILVDMQQHLAVERVGVMGGGRGGGGGWWCWGEWGRGGGI